MDSLVMQHPSRPGFYGCVLDTDVRAAVRDIADLMIPGSGSLPPAGEIVAQFVEQRVSPDESAQLSGVVRALGRINVESLRELEANHPDDFAVLRFWTYQGYYGSPIVAGLMQLGGSAYHGAPQPLGYALDREAPTPSESRGTFIPTNEVKRVRF